MTQNTNTKKELKNGMPNQITLTKVSDIGFNQAIQQAADQLRAQKVTR